MVGDLAFLPLEVFLVMIVVERILVRRGKQAILEKLNRVVGAFFSEVGTELLNRLLSCLETSSEICQRLAVSQNWTLLSGLKEYRFCPPSVVEYPLLILPPGVVTTLSFSKSVIQPYNY